MIKYDPLWKTLKAKGISQNRLMRDYGVDPAQLHRLRKNMRITTGTIDRFCQILDCRVEDIMEYVPQNENEDIAGENMEQKTRNGLNMGENLRILREKSRFSQEQVCARLRLMGYEIGRTTYAKYESGELNIPTALIFALKLLYNCSYDDFFAELKQETENKQ